MTEEHHTVQVDLDGDRAVVDFDHHGGYLPACSHEIYSEMREKCPVAWTEAHGGYWVITGHDEVAEASRDDKTFASGHYGEHLHGITIPPQPMYAGLIETDAPRFLALRQAFNPWFSPGAAAAAQPQIERFTHFCIDQFIEQGHCDLTSDLASPVPAMQTMDLLGLPLEDWETLADLMHRETYTGPDDPARPLIHEQKMELIQQLYRLAAERREHPGDDFISFLATVEIDGEVLPIDEVAGNCFLMLAGGVDTTTALLAHSFIDLDAHPEKRAALLDDPERIHTACEEYLRWVTPVQGLARTVTRDCVLGDQQLRQHDRVWISWASSNLDPTAFHDAEDIAIDRFPNRHAAFGLGVHRCIGSNVARVVWKTVVTAVLERMPDYELDRDSLVRYPSIGITNGWAITPATFTPGASTRTAAPGKG